MMPRVSPRTNYTIITAVLAALTVPGCSEEGACEGGGDCLYVAEPKPVEVEARVSPSVALAGAHVNVDCRVHYDDGSIRTAVAPAVVIDVAPAYPDTTIVDGVLTVLHAGSYRVACNMSGVESRVAMLEIQSSDPVRSIATLDRPSIASGESTGGHCRVEDANGNEVSSVATTLAASPSTGVMIADSTITGVRSGNYDITCSSGSVRLERVPAVLQVTAGAPIRIETQVTSYSARAGEPVGVTCFVVDAAGNQVTTDTTFSVSPMPTMQDDLGFSSTAVGQYSVVCSIPNSSLSSEPAVVQVNPSYPARLEITAVTPVKAAYVRHDVVELSVQMFDIFGNETTTPTWEITSIPAGAARFAGLHRVDLDADGAVTLVASVTSQTEGGSPVSDSRMVIVDGTAPEVVFDTPLRGEIVQGAEGAVVPVRGQVVEMGSGVAALDVNGLNVPVDATGHFDTTLPTAWGINLIRGSVTDVAGNTKAFVQSFEYAASYKRASPSRTISGKIDNGLVVHLGQQVLDDNNADIDDLATIAKLAIMNADVAALIPDPATSFHSDCSVWFVTITGDLRLYVDNVTFGTPTIDITAINGGLHLRASIPAVSVDMHTSGDVCDVGVGISGNASVTRAVVEGDLIVSRSGSGVTVSMPSASVTLTGLTIDLNLPGVIDWAVDGIISLFTGAIADRLEDALQDVIRSEVPPVVDQFLSSVAIGTGFDLPPPLGVHLDISSVLGLVDFQPGAGDLGFDTTIYSTGVLTPEPRGGILQFTHVPATFGASNPLGAAICFDLLNQALYSAWYGGALDLDLTDFVAPQLPGSNGGMLNVTATANALLPPVLSPSSDPTYPIQLQIGDLEIAVHLEGVPNLPPVDLTIYASAYGRASATVNAQNEIDLMLAPAPDIYLELMGSIEGIAEASTLTSQLESTMEQLLPLLFNDAINGIPIPTLDLSSVAGGVLPPGIVLGIGSVQTSVQPSYIVLEGSVVDMP